MLGYFEELHLNFFENDAKIYNYYGNVQNAIVDEEEVQENVKCSNVIKIRLIICVTKPINQKEKIDGVVNY